MTGILPSDDMFGLFEALEARDALLTAMADYKDLCGKLLEAVDRAIRAMGVLIEQAIAAPDNATRRPIGVEHLFEFKKELESLADLAVKVGIEEAAQ